MGRRPGCREIGPGSIPLDGRLCDNECVNALNAHKPMRQNDAITYKKVRAGYMYILRIGVFAKFPTRPRQRMRKGSEGRI